MMSSIKNKRKRNDDDELSKHFQNVEILIRQESNIILEKIIQAKTRNDNENLFNHKFSENDVVDYTALVKKKRTRNKNLKVKK